MSGACLTIARKAIRVHFDPPPGPARRGPATTCLPEKPASGISPSTPSGNASNRTPPATPTALPLALAPLPEVPLREAHPSHVHETSHDWLAGSISSGPGAPYEARSARRWAAFSRDPRIRTQGSPSGAARELRQGRRPRRLRYRGTRPTTADRRSRQGPAVLVTDRDEHPGALGESIVLVGHEDGFVAGRDRTDRSGDGLSVASLLHATSSPVPMTRFRPSSRRVARLDPLRPFTLRAQGWLRRGQVGLGSEVRSDRPPCVRRTRFGRSEIRGASEPLEAGERAAGVWPRRVASLRMV